MMTLGETLKSCSQSCRNISLSKKDLAKIDGFVNSSHEYAPYSAAVRAAAASHKKVVESAPESARQNLEVKIRINQMKILFQINRHLTMTLQNNQWKEK